MKNNRSYRKLYIVFFIIVLQGYSPLTFCQDNVIDSGFKQLFSGSQLQDPGNKRDSIGQCMQMMYEYHYYVSYIELYGCDHFSWYPAFNYPDFMDWLFNQKK